MDRKFLLPLIAVALLVVVAVFAFRGREQAAASPEANQALLAAIEKMDGNQSKLVERLDRLESLYGRTDGSGRPRPMGAPSAGAGNGPGNEGVMASPAQQEAQAAKQQHDLEAKLVSEPISAKWAATNEKAIASFLSPANLAKQQLPAPKNYQAQCRSQMCRISMTFADEGQAMQTQSQLLMEIANGLPAATIFQHAQPDGSLELLIFAGNSGSVRP